MPARPQDAWAYPTSLHVYVRGKRLAVSAAQAIGKGGEADVYDLGQGLALKVWKPPGHPDLAGDPALEEAARQRIAERQQKLRAFPGALPRRVVCPVDLATDRSGGQVVGYTMRLLAGAEPLLAFGERTFRQAGAGPDRAVRVFRDLHETLGGVHRAGVVIGDFNDLNVLVAGVEVHLIDADSFQFGPYRCAVFTERLVDPRLCDPGAPRPALLRPHDRDSDWYAFAAMLFRSLLLVDPFGGVYVAPPQEPPVPHPRRPLRRISVLHPGVRYPKPAEPPDVLPDDLLHHFTSVFERDLRGEFPLPLLTGLRFTRCDACGAEHARAVCPRCAKAAPAAVRSVTRVRGRVVATEVYRTRGTILEAAVAGGRLRVLAHEAGCFRREDGSVAFTGERDPFLKLRLLPDATLVGRGSELVTLRTGRPPERTATDRAGSFPAFDASGTRRFYVRDGTLFRDGELSEERIGDLLRDQTELWAGPRFGLGFYRAGELFVGFVFDAERGGLDDTVRLPRPRGRLTRAAAAFTDELAWLLMASVEAGVAHHQGAVVARSGHAEAAWTGDELAGLTGFLAAGRSLLAATDEGLVRFDLDGPHLVRAREFPETEPFVDAGCRLLAAPASGPGASPEGLLVVDRQEVRLLTMG